WGAVVNEAMMRGVPAICSDACGAADLLATPGRGEVYPAGTVGALCEVLGLWISRGKLRQELSDEIRHWSACIDGHAAADYPLPALEASTGRRAHPDVPWLLPQPSRVDASLAVERLPSAV